MRPGFGKILCGFVLVIVLGLAALVFLLWRGKSEDAGVLIGTEVCTADSANELLLQAKLEGKDEILEEMKELLDSGLTAVEAFRIVYEDEIVIASGGKYHFIPIKEDLKKHSYLEENLQVTENGDLQYVVDGEVVSHKGIDVSRFQGEIDWNAVAASGVEFAFIRLGYRGYGTGEIVEDSKFKDNIEGASAAGIKVGVYFFSQAVTEAEVLEEAAFVLERLAGYQLDCPVVFDVEKVSDSSARMNKISVEERTAFVKLFCDTIAAAGYRSMLYTNLEMASLLLNLEELESYDKWLAYYNRDFYFPYEFKVWQYSESGRVDGIPENVDLNISFEPLWE